MDTILFKISPHIGEYYFCCITLKKLTCHNRLFCLQLHLNILQTQKNLYHALVEYIFIDSHLFFGVGKLTLPINTLGKSKSFKIINKRFCGKRKNTTNREQAQ